MTFDQLKSQGTLGSWYVINKSLIHTYLIEFEVIYHRTSILTFYITRPWHLEEVKKPRMHPMNEVLNATLMTPICHPRYWTCIRNNTRESMSP